MPDDAPLPNQPEFPSMKRGRGRPPNAGGAIKNVVTVRGRAEWSAWLDRFAAASGDDKALLIETGLARLAREMGFTELPPPRV